MGTCLLARIVLVVVQGRREVLGSPRHYRIRQVLGHEHLNTTEIYTHIENTELKIAAQANPLANFYTEEEL